MVAGAELRQHIDLDLRIVRLELEDLPEVDRLWESDTDVNRFVKQQEWEDVLARLRWLGEQCTQSEMTADQRERYQGVLSALAAARPVLLRLRLAAPGELAHFVHADP